MAATYVHPKVYGIAIASSCNDYDAVCALICRAVQEHGMAKAFVTFDEGGIAERFILDHFGMRTREHVYDVENVMPYAYTVFVRADKPDVTVPTSRINLTVKHCDVLIAIHKKGDIHVYHAMRTAKAAGKPVVVPEPKEPLE